MKKTGREGALYLEKEEEKRSISLLKGALSFL